MNELPKNLQKCILITGVKDETLAISLKESLSPLNIQVVVGSNYPSFSKMMNTIINISKTNDIIIFCSHRVRPTVDDVKLLIQKLNENYGVVCFHRLAFFGFKIELIKRIGFFDERFFCAALIKGSFFDMGS